MKYLYEVMRNYDGTENMMMSITNIEGSLQDSEHKDQIEVMMSVPHEIQNTQREIHTLKMVTHKEY